MSAKRGTELRPGNRFERTSLERFDDGWTDVPDALDLPVVQTEFVADHSRSILSKNESPDLGFSYSINAYRGCEHGCAYCYARPSHEYLGYNAGIDFESRITVKHDAPRLLREAFERKSWEPQAIVMSGNTDCYQPAEREFRLTRQLLEVLLEYRNPVWIITKNALIMRDADILEEMAALGLVSVDFSVTTLDRDLARKLEPRTSTPGRRLAAMQALNERGVPAGVMIGPVIPGLNDEEIPRILEAASAAGAREAGFNIVRLPLAVEPIFNAWLDEHVPLEAAKIRNRIQMVRNGRMSDSDFATRQHGTGAYADLIGQLFRSTCKRLGLNSARRELATHRFRRGGQASLFD